MISVILITVMLAIELLYLTQFRSFLGCFFSTYLSLFLYVCGLSLTTFKEFGIFWLCYFVDPLVKVTDNFWKVCGMIDGFNELHRQIASGVDKMVVDSISAI